MEPEPLFSSTSSTLNLDDSIENAERERKNPSIWQRGGGRTAEASKGDGTRAGDYLTKDFLRKYMHFAKSKIKPVLSEQAMLGISDAYTTMRSKQTSRNLPVTARSLETIIRLSTAHAKARLSVSVEEQDVKVAVDLVNHVLYGEIEVAPTTGSSQAKRNGVNDVEEIEGSDSDGTDGDNNNGDDDDEDDDGGDREDDSGLYKPRLSKRRKVLPPDSATGSKSSLGPLAQAMENNTVRAAMIDRQGEHYTALQGTINKIITATGTDRLHIDDVMERLSRSHSELRFKEVEHMLREMEADNQVMYEDGIIHIL